MYIHLCSILYKILKGMEWFTYLSNLVQVERVGETKNNNSNTIIFWERRAKLCITEKKSKKKKKRGKRKLSVIFFSPSLSLTLENCCETILKCLAIYSERPRKERVDLYDVYIQTLGMHMSSDVKTLRKGCRLVPGQ